jgi:hypothetical protein
VSWVRIDDRTPDHPKFESLSDNAWALWTKALCWTCQPEHQRTGGFIPRVVALGLLKSGHEAALEAASELVEAKGDRCFGHASGLWFEAEGGWGFHDWEEYRPKPCFGQNHEAASEAGRLGGLRSAQKRREKFGTAQPIRAPKPASKTKPEAVLPKPSEAGPEAPVPSRPDPVLREDPPTPLPKHDAPRDRLAESFESSNETQQLFDAWKVAVGMPEATIRKPWDPRVDDLKSAIRTYGLEACLLVASFCMNDGMVNGKSDEKRHAHKTIEYIFGNSATFERILHAAQQQKNPPRVKVDPSEAYRRATE